MGGARADAILSRRGGRGGRRAARGEGGREAAEADVSVIHARERQPLPSCDSAPRAPCSYDGGRQARCHQPLPAHGFLGQARGTSSEPGRRPRPGGEKGHRPRPVHRAAAGTAGDSGGGRPARPAGPLTAVAWTLQTGAVHRETALRRAVEAGRAGQGSRGRAGHSRRCLDGPGYRGAEELAQRCPRPPPSLLSVPCEPCLADGAQGPSFAVDAEPV